MFKTTARRAFSPGGIARGMMASSKDNIPARKDNAPSWVQVSLSAPMPDAEAFADLITGLSGLGVLWQDEDPANPTVTGYLAKDARTPARLEEMGAWAESRGLQLALSDLAGEDWGKNWKKHFRPFAAAKGLVIAPPWDIPGAAPGEKVLVIDPGMAFGTGQHATTGLCLDFLADLAGEGRLPSRMLDVGSGTGVLALYALLLGTESALGLENDPDAVDSAQKNIRLNHLEGRITVENTGLGVLAEKFPLVVSNIIRDTLIELAPLIRPRLAEGGLLALTGLLLDQTDDVAKVYGELGLKVIERRDRGEWSLLVLA